MWRMGRFIWTFALATLLLPAALPVAAPAAPRNRGLERLVEGRFPAEEGDRLARAFQAALKAGVGEREALALVESCLEGGFEAPQVQRVLTLASQLRLENIPTGSFAAKIEEGVAKRVAAERVLQAAERRALMLNRARLVVNAVILEGLEVDEPEELLQDIAEALEAGRSQDQARRIVADSLREGDGAGEIRRKLFP